MAGENRRVVDDLSERFPSNAYSDRNIEKVPHTTPDKPRLASVAKGKVVKKKKGFLKKVKDAFIGDETNNIGDYFIYDVLVPALKSTVDEFIKGGVDMFLYGERRYRGGYSGGFTSYDKYSKSRMNQNRPGTGMPTRGGQRDISYESRIRQDFDITYDSKGEAEEVLDRLLYIITEYGAATVAEYYSLSGVQPQHTDAKYGWVSLRDAYTERRRDGYTIVLPRAKPL